MRRPGSPRSVRSGPRRAVRPGPLLAVALAVALLLPGPAGPATAQGAPPADLASYRLAVRLDRATMQIVGEGRITYRNPGPDTLQELWLRLYLNAFRSLDTPWMRAADAAMRERFDPAHPGWVRVERLARAGSGQPLQVPPETEDTVVRVPLDRPLGPGETLELDVAWTSQLPRVVARTGFAGDFVFAGQWYPKLAVYDRGRWDDAPWHPRAEFFADFGSYDLALTVPQADVTGATGQRVGETPNADGTRTVSYHADRVTDVAWTAWPDYVVESREIEAAGQRVQLEVLLPPQAESRLDRHLAAASAALDGFGRWYGPYPWPKLTIVVPPADGSAAGGMEYPTLVTTGLGVDLPAVLASGVLDVEEVTVHEIAHQWFPMQVQSNEAAEPWLDEGFATYLATRVLSRLRGPGRSQLDLPFARVGHLGLHRLLFVTSALRQPLAQPAASFPSSSVWASTAYSKGMLALMTLEGAYGDEAATRAFRAYADRWRWRHPTSADLQAVLEEQLGPELRSFFDAFVYGGDVVDYRVAAADEARAVVERRGGGRVPVEARLTLADGTERRERWDAAGERLELTGDGRPVVGVAVDPDARISLQVERLADARELRADPVPALAVASRWLSAVQAFLQLVGQIG